MRRFAFAALTAAGFAAASAAQAQPGRPAPPPPEIVAEPACEALAAPGLFKDMTVTKAQAVRLGAGSDCEIVGIISPVPGSKIGVVYRLPKQWNGRLVGYGGGGWAGNVAFNTVANDLNRGYATMQTDGGHPSPNAGDASWTAPNGKADEIANTDFSWRAVHQMTVTGKQVAARYYGKPQDKALFIGCSTGGRMALMEAQRFPEDYDGIVAGAPVYSLRVQLAEIYRDCVFAQPGAALKPADQALAHDAVLAQCDAQDGVKDGVLGDPTACKFEPASLKCKPGQASGCLTDAQVLAMNRVYAQVKGPDGQVYIYPYSRGSEPAWPMFQNVSADPKAPPARDLGLRVIMFGDANFSFADFDPQRDGPKARAGAFAKDYEADDPNLKPFLGRGGKLILWHGQDDPGPSPWSTVAYDERMKAATGAALAASNTRFFLAPGVLHCQGGPGPSQIDWLAPLDAWVQGGAAPEHVTARTPPAPPGRPGQPAPAPVRMVVRPVCAYPAHARWDGKGSTDVEESFSCK